MKSILELLSIESLCLLLTSPPASGKTRLVFEILRETEFRILFISPLRAILEELKAKLIDFDYCEINKGPINEMRVVLATAELYKGYWERLDSDENLIVIVDEYHLFYQWDSFRHKLSESRKQILKFHSRVLLLTATFSKDFLKKLCKESDNYFALRFHLDLGNFKILNPPKSVIKTYNHFFQLRVVFLAIILLKLFFRLEDKPTLIFIQNKKLVRALSIFCSSIGVDCLSCVGGKAKAFTDELKQKVPQLIISTSVLSHGVNLPSLKRVFLWSSINDRSMFVQMLTRAGRRGESYQALISGARFMKKKLKYNKSVLIGLVKVLWN